jgi:glutathione synthase/RimK-type ligase-like ATP-grasp enzyme
VIDVAIRAAAPIGLGLYGVDVKVLEDGRVVVIEVNDNPNIDAGGEDGVAGDHLYTEIMEHFRRLLETRGRRG